MNAVSGNMPRAGVSGRAAIDEAGRRTGVSQDALEGSAVLTIRYPGEQAGPSHFRQEGLCGQRS